MKKITEIKRVLSSRSGMSIVSVTVAFVILLLATSMFVATAVMSSQFIRGAMEEQTAFCGAAEKYYTETLGEPDAVGSGFVLLDGSNKITFSSKLYLYTDAESGLKVVSFGKHTLITEAGQ